MGTIGDDLGHVLSSVEAEWAVAALSAGALVSTLVGGTYSDKLVFCYWLMRSFAKPLLSRIGRKPVLMIGDGCFILGGIVICTAFSLVQFIIGRVLMGFGVGIAAVTCAVYIGEVAPSKFRGRLIAVQSVCVEILI